MRDWLNKVRERLLPGNGLGSRAFAGGSLLAMGSVAEQAFRFGRNMLLTRLLFPEAFGLMAIVYSTSSIVDMLTEIGVKEAVIQNPRGNEARYLNAAWWLGILRGAGIYVVLFTSAPLVASFYGNAQLTGLMRIALLSAIFFGAQSSKSFAALKQMQFKRWTIIQSGSGVMGSLSVVLLAMMMHSVWALAIGSAFESFLRFAVSFWICPFRPRLEIDRPAVKDLLTFSRGVFGLSLLNLIYARSDIFVLGKLYPSADLGVYTMAVYVIQVPVSFLVNVLAQSLLPTLSQIQDDYARINRIVTRLTVMLTIAALPALIFLILSSQSILSLLYGARYETAAWPLRFAAIAGAIYLANTVLTVVFYTTGRPQYHRRCVLIMAVLMVLLVYPCVKQFGMVGGQVATVVAGCAGYAAQLLRIREVTGLRLSDYGRRLALFGGVSAVVLGCFVAIRQVITLGSPLPNLAFGISGSLLALAISGGVLMNHASKQDMSKSRVDL